MYLHCFHINKNNLQYKVTEENGRKAEVFIWRKKNQKTFSNILINGANT